MKKPGSGVESFLTSMLDAPWMRRRESFYERALGPMRQPAVYHWEDDGNPHVDVYAIGRSASRPFETLITGGMADRPQPGVRAGEDLPRRVELVMKIDKGEHWAAMVLRELASLPFLFGVRLSAGAMVRGSRPVQPESNLRHAVLGPAGETGLDGFTVDGEAVTFLLVHLVTEAELERGVEAGGGALLSLLAERSVSPVVDVGRSSVV